MLCGMLPFANARRGTDGRRYRMSCEGLILEDFEFAYNHEIEQKLWDAHVKINKRYQKMLNLVSQSYRYDVERFPYLD